MIFKIEPKNFNRKSIPSKPRSPMDVEVRNMYVTGLSQEFTVTDVSDEDYFTTLKMVGLDNRQAFVDMFPNNIYNNGNRTMSWTYSCSCEDYTKHECGCCKHIAVIRSTLNNTANLPDYSGLRSHMFNMPYAHNTGTNADGGINYHYYDSLACRNVTLNPVKGLSQDARDVYARSYQTAMLMKNEYKPDSSPLEIPDNYSPTPGIFLKQHQTDAARMMIKAKRAICAMYMGKGKTFTTVSLMKILDSRDILIVCPKAVMNQWKNEIARCTGRSVVFLTGQNVEKFSKTTGTIGICTYATVARNYKILNRKWFNMVVADEIQFIRNNECKAWSGLNQIRSEYFYGLSGTVVENRLDDLYNVMEIVNPGVLGAKWKFDAQHRVLGSVCTTKVLYKNQTQDLDSLRRKIKDSVYSYFDENGAIPDQKVFYTEMGDETRRLHDWYTQQIRILIAMSLQNPLTPQQNMMLQSFQLRARQCCNSISLVDRTKTETSQKIAKIVQIIQDTVNAGEKIVVFSEWTTMLGMVKTQLPSTVKWVDYDGSLSSNARTAAVEKFQNDPDCKIFFSSDAGSVGLDGLQKVCSTMIHTELPWNPGKLDQRIGRLNRMGQEKNVTVYFTVAKDSFESKIESLIDSKRNVRNGVIFGINEVAEAVGV